MPGVGKTITSKMLTLKYVEKGYSIRYVTNNSIDSIKKSLSISPEKKELVLLDDCLGQYYFKIKETQENEMISLIKYMSMHENKVLIMNSRVTIYNESKRRSLEFSKSIEDKTFKIHTINMDNINKLEKAKILYNHFYFNLTPPEYFNEIRKNKNYLKIIEHINYNPRIIEFICGKTPFDDVSVKDYFSHIMNTLSNPCDIWQDEYTLKIETMDRILLNTLFSLTDTEIEDFILRDCFNKRLSNITGIDTTLNHYENSIERLNNSFIKIIDKHNTRKVGVVNQSVNDFLSHHIKKNPNEVNNIKDNIISVKQANKMYNRKPERFLEQELSNTHILEYIFENKSDKHIIITSLISKFSVCNHKYDSIIIAYLDEYYSHIHPFVSVEFELSRNDTIKMVLSEPLISFYSLQNYLLNIDKLSEFMDNLYIEELTEIINCLHSAINNTPLEYKEQFFKKASASVMFEFEKYPDDDMLETYLENYDLAQIANDSIIEYDEDYSDIDIDKIISEVESLVYQDVYDEAVAFISKLPQEIASLIDCSALQFNIASYNLDYTIRQTLDQSQKEYEYSRNNISENEYAAEIETIFERHTIE